MPDGKKKMISKETGTVPKVKYWNNTAVLHDSHVANNLASPMLPNQERSHSELRNRQRCSNYHCFEGLCVEDSRVLPNYNSLPYINMSGGTTSPSTSGSNSRRHSGGAIRKCDNITKYPDKKQIEDKLNQIREYLKVTSSLMSSVKEDQSQSDENIELYEMLSALRDSEKKLEAMLTNKDISEADNSPQAVEKEASENGIPTLDSESVFQTFQNNVAARSEIVEKMEHSDRKLQALHEHTNVLMRLQEKAENQLRNARKAQERLASCANGVQYPQQIHPETKDNNRCIELSSQSDIESQTEHLGLMPSTNEGRGQLLRMLDARDNELCAEQHALQQKLQELSSKKQQIDQLVSQLHSYGGGGGGGDTGSEDGDDMANQIRQIVAMKEQLATLKDMLSAVKSTEAALLHQNSVERSECGEIPIVKSENVPKSSSLGLSDSEIRSEPDRRWGTLGKQSNKSSISSSREQLQAELQAKKQELEELMYKDQDRTSAINQDVCSELVLNKAEQSFSLDSVPSSWTLLQDNTPPRDSCVSRENVYSSDEEELENYTQLNNDTAKPVDYVHCNFRKQIPNPIRPVLNCNPPLQDTASSPSVSQNFPQFSGAEHKQQLELMTSLCQSLLEQQRQVMPTQCNPPNFQWYTSYMQMQQALMLSTISQCCQLLWLQQQDINSLINTVNMMQRKPPQTINVSHPPSETVGSACSLPTRLPSNNTEYPGIATRDRVSPQNLTRNIPVPVGVIPQPQPVWTGNQALNNQVAPGNRANNYWDNFRSYSRQNLLSTSTKSNEGSQNSLSMLDRSNAGTFSQPVSLHRSQQSTLPKINTPIHEGFADSSNHESQRERSTSRTERAKTAKRNRANRNRNEWNEETPQVESSPQKSKLFEVLRENVYKEVTLLISANENRPHFLIQLFRDLQLISSDPLRRSALHSIQALISRSFIDTNASTPTHSGQCSSDERLPTSTSFPQPQPQPQPSAPPRNKPEKSSSSSRYYMQPNTSEPVNQVSSCKLDADTQRILIELLPILKSHNEDVFHNGLIDMIKIMIFQLLPTKQTAASNKLQAKLDAMFNESLAKYKGKRIMDIREDLLKTIADILLEELPTPTSSTKERPNSESRNHNHKSSDNISAVNPLLFLGEPSSLSFEPFQFLQLDQKPVASFGNAPRVDNGDLAEADQSRREAENEEGAVGGLLDGTNEAEVCLH